MHKHLKAKPKHVHDIEYSSSSTDFLRHIIRDHEYAMIFLVNEVVTCNKVLSLMIVVPNYNYFYQFTKTIKLFRYFPHLNRF